MIRAYPQPQVGSALLSLIYSVPGQIHRCHKVLLNTAYRRPTALGERRGGTGPGKAANSKLWGDKCHLFIHWQNGLIGGFPEKEISFNNFYFLNDQMHTL